MNTHADKASKNKGQVIANGLAKLRQGESKSPFQFADNRPEAVAQRRLQELADKSQQVSRLRSLQQLANASPHVSQLKSLQRLANNSPQVKQAAQLQAQSSAKAPSPIQQEIASGIAQLAQVPEEKELIQAKPQTAQLRPDPAKAFYHQRSGGQEIAQLNGAAFSVSTSDLEGVTGQTSVSGGYGQDVIQREAMQVMLGGKLPRVTMQVTYSDSAARHVGSDAATLKQTTLQALANEGITTVDQGDGVHRFKINDGKGYLVYKRTDNDVKVFHFHWNYKLDDPLN